MKLGGLLLSVRTMAGSHPHLPTQDLQRELRSIGNEAIDLGLAASQVEKSVQEGQQVVSGEGSGAAAVAPWRLATASAINRRHALRGRFEWVDGPLLEAMEKGYWAVLDNANLCSATVSAVPWQSGFHCLNVFPCRPLQVLDRLNSALEPNGFLLVNEAGMVDGKPRIIYPHKNFRLFLCVDPTRAEVSRAMRNRCAEIYLSPSATALPSSSAGGEDPTVTAALSCITPEAVPPSTEEGESLQYLLQRPEETFALLSAQGKSSSTGTAALLHAASFNIVTASPMKMDTAVATMACNDAAPDTVRSTASVSAIEERMLSLIQSLAKGLSSFSRAAMGTTSSFAALAEAASLAASCGIASAATACTMASIHSVLLCVMGAQSAAALVQELQAFSSMFQFHATPSTATDWRQQLSTQTDALNAVLAVIRRGSVAQPTFRDFRRWASLTKQALMAVPWRDEEAIARAAASTFNLVSHSLLSLLCLQCLYPLYFLSSFPFCFSSFAISGLFRLRFSGLPCGALVPQHPLYFPACC